MRFNQFSYFKTSSTQALNDLVSLGFNLKPTDSEKKQFEDFIRKIYFTCQNTDYPLSILSSDKKTDLLTFFQFRQRVDCRYFLHCSLSTFRLFLFC